MSTATIASTIRLKSEVRGRLLWLSAVAQASALKLAPNFATRFPLERVVGSADVAALAVHIMANTALMGATDDVDGGQRFVAA